MIKNWIRRLKFSYQLYNFFHKKKLLHIHKQYKKLGLKKKYYNSVSNSDFKEIPHQKPWLDVQNSTIALKNNELVNSLSTSNQNAILNWSNNGYAILNSFFTHKEIDEVNKDIEQLIANKEANWRYSNKKIMFAHKQCNSIFNMANNAKLCAILSLLLGKNVQLFQSINFLAGSGQQAHSDSIHMSTFPLGNLIAVWIALEDISIEQGALHYYSGSHKLPYIMNADFNHGGNKYMLGKTPNKNFEEKITDMIRKKELLKEVFEAKKGDILIWHANLLHGGEPHTNKELTRKSMVFHYFAEDVVCYHEITQRPALI